MKQFLAELSMLISNLLALFFILTYNGLLLPWRLAIMVLLLVFLCFMLAFAVAAVIAFYASAISLALFVICPLIILISTVVFLLALVVICPLIVPAIIVASIGLALMSIQFFLILVFIIFISPFYALLFVFALPFCLITGLRIRSYLFIFEFEFVEIFLSLIHAYIT